MTICVSALDSAGGSRARNLGVTLHARQRYEWVVIARTRTDDTGRVEFARDGSLSPGIYRLVFDTQEYFEDQAAAVLFPEVVLSVIYQGNAQSVSLTLLLSPFSYTTFAVSGAGKQAFGLFPDASPTSRTPEA